MKICVAQTRPITGDVRRNIDNHRRITDLAALHGVDIIIFPELSITGYEPTLAKTLATQIDDERFSVLQTLSDSKKIVIGAGMPIGTDDGIAIGMILFRPCREREIYFKQYIHPDEEPYFINGIHRRVLSETNIAIAVCYEISIPRHAEQAHGDGATIYIASVAKTPAGVRQAIETLSATAKKFSMTVLMANCVGINDGLECGGRSSVWNNEGTLLGQLNERDEGFIVFDAATQEVIKEQKEYSFFK